MNAVYGYANLFLSVYSKNVEKPKKSRVVTSRYIFAVVTSRQNVSFTFTFDLKSELT